MIGNMLQALQSPRTSRIQQSFRNDRDKPIYILVEIWPECFELEPGEKLTLIWDGPQKGDASSVDFISEDEITVWPEGNIDRMQFLIDGESARDRSWKFKHRSYKDQAESSEP